MMGTFGPRIYLTGQALQALIQSNYGSVLDSEEIATLAVRIADATLDKLMQEADLYLDEQSNREPPQ